MHISILKALRNQLVKEPCLILALHYLNVFDLSRHFFFSNPIALTFYGIGASEKLFGKVLNSIWHQVNQDEVKDTKAKKDRRLEKIKTYGRLFFFK